MKIYKLGCNVNKYAGYFINDKELHDIISNNILQGNIVDNWQPIKVTRDNEIDGNAHISHLWSSVGNFIVNKKAKLILEKNFSDKIQFLKVIDDKNNEELYMLNFLNYVDALDYEKSVFKRSDVIKPFIKSIEKYVFNDEALDNEIFRLLLENRKKRRDIYTNDKFKELIEKEGLTGLVFEELYDSDKK